jgi:hypothetical protein
MSAKLTWHGASVETREPHTRFDGHSGLIFPGYIIAWQQIAEARRIGHSVLKEECL